MTNTTNANATPDQNQRDRAHEWTAENYPDADGAEYEQRFGAALAHIVALDAANAREDAGLAVRTTAVQERWIETLATSRTRPYFRVIAPDTWTDDEIRNAFRPRTGRWVGYLCPKGEHGCAGSDRFPVCGTVWLGLNEGTMLALAAAGGARSLLDSELDALSREASPDLAAALAAERARRAEAQ